MFPAAFALAIASSTPRMSIAAMLSEASTSTAQLSRACMASMYEGSWVTSERAFPPRGALAVTPSISSTSFCACWRPVRSMDFSTSSTISRIWMSWATTIAVSTYSFRTSVPTPLAFATPSSMASAVFPRYTACTMSSWTLPMPAFMGRAEAARTPEREDGAIRGLALPDAGSPVWVESLRPGRPLPGEGDLLRPVEPGRADMGRRLIAAAWTSTWTSC
mmetsp:Transcript_29015/g.81736  ORF Transcript_29015/g.81736 Transcript_29015/m.81736 type:complete len:219 (+) Transcript_29015:762-1418(+)